MLSLNPKMAIFVMKGTSITTAGFGFLVTGNSITLATATGYLVITSTVTFKAQAKAELGSQKAEDTLYEYLLPSDYKKK